MSSEQNSPNAAEEWRIRRARQQASTVAEFEKLGLKVTEPGDPDYVSPSVPVDTRSALVLVEPIHGPGQVYWHGMAFVAGKVVNDITGINRAVVLDDCWCTLAAEGIEVDVEET